MIDDKSKDLQPPAKRPARIVYRAPLPPPPPRIEARNWSSDPKNEPLGKAEFAALQKLKSAVETCESKVAAASNLRFSNAKWNVRRRRWEEIARPEIDECVKKCLEAGISDRQEFVELLERVGELDRGWSIACQFQQELDRPRPMTDKSEPAGKDVQAAINAAFYAATQNKALKEQDNVLAGQADELGATIEALAETYPPGAFDVKVVLETEEFDLDHLYANDQSSIKYRRHAPRKDRRAMRLIAQAITILKIDPNSAKPADAAKTILAEARKQKRSALGLETAKGILDLYGGKIDRTALSKTVGRVFREAKEAAKTGLGTCPE